MGFWCIAFIVMGIAACVREMFRLIDWLERPTKRSSRRAYAR